MNTENRNVPIQKEVDCVGHYYNVAIEMAAEPFFGEDHHDSLCTQAGRVVSVNLEHPALFRSALSHFRRLWMVGEPSHFCYVRNLLYRYQRTGQYDSLRDWFFAYYKTLVKQLQYPDLIGIPNRELIDIWINTQLAHAEKTSKNGKFTARDFDQLAKTCGREVIEYVVRQGVRFVGSVYLNLNRMIVAAELDRYEREFSLKPSFVTKGSLESPSYKPLVHESLIQALERLLRRNSYRQIASLFQQMFATPNGTLHAVVSSRTLAEVLKRAKWTILGAELPSEILFQAKSQFSELVPPWRSGGFVVFEGRRVFFADDGFLILQAQFQSLRETLNAERPDSKLS